MMKNIIRISLVLTFLIFNIQLSVIHAQIAINTSGSSPDASAILDITSSEKGILIPRMTTIERQAISSPATGLLIFDTDENSFWYYTTAWVEINSNNLTALEDADNDTKIQVEESSDEDMIRFDLGGTEFLRLDNGRIEPMNNGNSVFIGEEAGLNDDFNNNVNTFVGYKAGQNNSSGNRNIFLGAETGQNNTSGAENVFLGFKAGNVNTTGNSNIFLGHKAGFNETGSNKLYIENTDITTPLIYGEFDNDLLQINGTLNIAGNYAFPTTDGSANQILTTDGSGTLSWVDLSSDNLSDADGDTKIQVEESSDEDIIRFDLDGTEFLRLDNGRIEPMNNGNSVFLGYQAGNDNTSGSSNVFIGEQAGAENKTGSYNTILGYKAGSYVTGTDRNVFIGNQAGAFETQSRRLHIADTATSFPLIYGEFDNQFLKINGTLSIKGNYEFPASDGNASQVLTTDGNGALSWVDFSSSVAVDEILDADGDTKIQVEESSDEDIIRFDLDGSEFIRLDGERIEILNNDGSIFIGEGAGENDDLSGSNHNTFMGYQSGYNNLTGAQNLFLGSLAGRSNTEGDYNVFLGREVGQGNTTGDNNLYAGYRAGQSNSTGHQNVFLGPNSGKNSTSSFNVFIGNESGKNTTGSSNVFVGNDAGISNTGGAGNVYIGNESGYSNTTGSNNVFIGNRAGYNETGDDKLYIENSNSSIPLIYGDFANDILEFNGDIGIGTTPTNGKLEIDGYIDNTINNYTYVSNVNSTVAYINNNTDPKEVSIYASDRIVGKFVISLSDERIKDIQGISDSEEDLAILNQIQITDYKFKDKIREGNTQQKKVIAQQVAEVFPQAVEKQTTEIIPDIYQTATIDENGWVTGCQLPVAGCPLKQGEKVQIIFDNKKELLEILEVKGNAFRVKPSTVSREPSTVHRSPSTVFIYGRQVTDFHTVDYQALSMLNVSATQQLAKEMEQLKKENEELKMQLQEVQNLKQQNTEMKAMLDQIQVQLNHQNQ